MEMRTELLPLFQLKTSLDNFLGILYSNNCLINCTENFVTQSYEQSTLFAKKKSLFYKII